MIIKKLKIKRESVVLQIYLIPFYFVVYMMFFRDPIKSGIWAEREFNLTVQNRTLDEVQQILGEPDTFQKRGDYIILDYKDLVYPKKRELRYPFVRLIFFDNRSMVLLPQNIYYKK